jgi:hypothetical protein
MAAASEEEERSDDVEFAKQIKKLLALKIYRRLEVNLVKVNQKPVVILWPELWAIFFQSIISESDYECRRRALGILNLSGTL